MSIPMSPLSSNGEEVTDDGGSGTPVVTEPGSVVGPTQVDSELFVSVGEGEEAVVVVEEVLVGTVGTFDFAVMSGGSDADQLVPDAEVLQGGVESAELI